jgi:hypothetical protein
VLIILYITTIVLIVTGLHPLIIAGIFFGICYLPGLTMLALIKKKDLHFEDFILALPVSIGISSILIFALLYAGIHVKFISYIIIGIVGLLILATSIKHKKLPSFNLKLSKKEVRFVIIAFLMTLIFSVPVISERITVSAHGLHHFTLVSQIMNGIFPPENSGMGGTPIGYHWGYHAFIAALSYPMDLNPLRIISMLNVISLFLVFCIAYSSARYLDFSEWNSYLVPLALIGLMRSDALIFIVNKFSSAHFLSLREVSFPEIRPSEILQSWIWGGGAPWFDRRMFFLNKYYNANSMPLGIGLCLSYFYLMLISLKKAHENKNNTTFTVTLSLLIIANCIIYPPLALVVLLHAPVWAGSVLVFKRTDFKAKLKDTLEILIPYALAVIISLPYLLSVSSNTGEPVIRIKIGDQSIINLVSFLLPMPVIIAGVFFSYKKLPSVIFYFLIAAASVCFGLSVFTEVVLNNSDKFAFILSFFYALYFVLATSVLLHFISNRWVTRILSAAVLVYLLVTPVITEAAYIISPWFRDHTYSFSGRHVVFDQDRKRNEAYTWIRNNTPPESLLMLTYVETTDPDDIAQNSAYQPAALSERNLFVIKDWYTFPNPEYTKRVSIRGKLFMNHSDPEVDGFFKSLNRPVYLLVEDELPPLYLEDKIFHNFPDNPEGFLLVFKNKNQRVYVVKK